MMIMVTTMNYVVDMIVGVHVFKNETVVEPREKRH